MIKRVYDMNNNEIIEAIIKQRQLTYSSLKIYRSALQKYSSLNELSLQELLEEAEREEESGIRWKHRKLKQRLTTYQNYLVKEYNYNTAKLYMSKVKVFYTDNDVEIHQLPPLNRKQAKLSTPIMFNDLPSKETIKEAYNLSTPLFRAYILFAISSGCAKAEILSLTRYDYYEWIKDKDPAIDDIVPTIRLKRQKTNKYYTTFCSPEAVREIHNYLKTRDDDDDRLFKVNERYLNRAFQELNDKLGLGRLNNRGILRPHMLRKYHASRLYNAENGLSLEEIDSLQGRSKNITRESYYYDNPEDLKKKYIRNIEQVTILDQVHTITVDSPEVEMLKKKAEKIDELEKLVKKIMERNQT